MFGTKGTSKQYIETAALQEKLIIRKQGQTVHWSEVIDKDQKETDT